MKVHILIFCFAIFGCKAHPGERQLLDPTAAGLSHSEQVAFLDRAHKQIQSDTALKPFLQVNGEEGYMVMAQAKQAKDISGLVSGAIPAGPRIGELPIRVVAVVWGHPLRSSYWLIYDQNGSYLGAFVLPEG